MKRFVLYNRPVIEQAPLQTYCSALVFAPAMSIVRNLFKDKIPAWIRRLPEVELHWSALRQILEGHEAVVSAVAFSPDCKLLAAASQDTVKIWDACSGAELNTLEGHATAVAFSSDGNLITLLNSTIDIWDANCETVLYTVEGFEDYSSWQNTVGFTQDGKLLASAYDNNTVKLWKLWGADSGAPLQTLEGHSAKVSAVALSPNGMLLASASEDGIAKIWDAKSGAELHTLDGHSSCVRAVAFSPNGSMLASASEDWTAKIWDAKSGAELHTLDGHSSYVRAGAFSPNGKMLASASWDETIRLWDTSSGAELDTLLNPSVCALTFSPDGKLLASASELESVFLWSVNLGGEQDMLGGHSRSVTTVTFSPNGKMLASASWDDAVKLWDTSSGTELQTLEGHSKLVDALSSRRAASCLRRYHGIIQSSYGTPAPERSCTHLRGIRTLLIPWPSHRIASC
jgi:WD40 repeat protein